MCGYHSTFHFIGMNNGYQKNEFDTSKFTLNYNSQKLNGFASKSHLDVFAGNSFGLDPDAPLFVNYPYGPGGIQLESGTKQVKIIYLEFQKVNKKL